MSDVDSKSTGQRMLAAIVFTDVVGFSTLANMDEAKTLRLLNRDIDQIRNIANAHQALVIKGTGDGLLMVFSSAVEAVNVAIEVQKRMFANALEFGASESLKHRLGIHLGDVVILEGDVVGDGVNVAARLQTEAKPGGICLSSAVYEVVKGKVNLKATNLGPRNLKHIIETVDVWMVPPIDEPAPAVKPQANVISGLELDSVHSDPSPSGGKLVLIVAGIAICVAALAFIVTQFSKPLASTGNSKKTVASNDRTTPTHRPSVGGNDPSRESTKPTTEETKEPDGSKPQSTGGAPTPGDLPVDEEIAKFASSYEFATAADRLAMRGDSRYDATIARYKRLAEFVAWITTSVQATTETNPLRVSGGGGSTDKDYELYGVGRGDMTVRWPNNEQQQVTLRQFEPRELLRITAAIFKMGAVSNDEKSKMKSAAEEFATEMRLTSIPNTL